MKAEIAGVAHADRGEAVLARHRLELLDERVQLRPRTIVHRGRRVRPTITGWAPPSGGLLLR